MPDRQSFNSWLSLVASHARQGLLSQRAGPCGRPPLALGQRAPPQNKTARHPPAKLYSSAMEKVSAGLLMYRIRNGELEFLLAHPGGPFWKNKDTGVWTIPKGEIQNNEDLLSAAKREFEEEIGMKPESDFLPLNPVRQKNGKIVHAWAFMGDCDPSGIKSNTFQLEWPPKSGRFQSCPEVDRAAFFLLDEAKLKINPAQIPLLEETARSITKPRSQSS
jgi:predicted NUDIX family NTP pyrophosphohydrolase